MEENDITYLINQVFEIKKKSETREVDLFDRNLNRIFDKFEEIGYKIVNPIGEKYSETRTDLQAHVTSENTDTLVIKEVLKPVLYYNESGVNTIVQKGVVVVG